MQGIYGAPSLHQLWEELKEKYVGQTWWREGCCPHQYSRLLGSTLAEVENLPWVEIPHEGLDDLGSLSEQGRLQQGTGSSQWTQGTRHLVLRTTAFWGGLRKSLA